MIVSVKMLTVSMPVTVTETVAVTGNMTGNVTISMKKRETSTERVIETAVVTVKLIKDVTLAVRIM